jgi:hypothetical protein
LFSANAHGGVAEFVTARRSASAQRWLCRHEPIPFELPDTGLLKLFFADALEESDALGLLLAIRRRSEERVAALHAIEPEAEGAEEDGASHPLLTLRMGIAFHPAMIEVSEGFERELSSSMRAPS